MRDWNAIVTVYDGEYGRAVRLLEAHGRVSATDFYNVLALAVPDIEVFLSRLREECSAGSELLNCVSRLVPVTETFSFQTPEEFEDKARVIVARWIPELSGKGFHVRMHRRGFRQQLSSQREEQLLGSFLLAQLRECSVQGHISLDDPDVIIAVETVGHWAGLSIWPRAELERTPFLALD